MYCGFHMIKKNIVFAIRELLPCPQNVGIKKPSAEKSLRDPETERRSGVAERHCGACAS